MSTPSLIQVANTSGVFANDVTEAECGARGKSGPLPEEKGE